GPAALVLVENAAYRRTVPSGVRHARRRELWPAHEPAWQSSSVPPAHGTPHTSKPSRPVVLAQYRCCSWPSHDGCAAHVSGAQDAGQNFHVYLSRLRPGG